MTKLNSLVDTITSQQSPQSHLPPVEQWDPAYCGELDLVIKADGHWIFDGTPFNHQRLKRLFSQVIKKEQDNYFLVTPVEKLGIQVEWQPFTLIDFQWINSAGKPVIQLTDNLHNSVQLTHPEQLAMSEFQSLLLPIFQLRRNLFASLSRNCYYQLIEAAKLVKIHGRHQLQIESNGIKFSIGDY